MKIIHKYALRFLIYGLFSVLCHSTAVLLFCRMNTHLPAYLLAHTALPMLEQTVFSLFIVLAGGALIHRSEILLNS